MQISVLHASLEIGFGLFGVLAAGFLIRYYLTRTGDNGKFVGVGLRAIQMTVAVITAPIILILALEQTISHETTGVLLGTLLGFLLSPKG